MRAFYRGYSSATGRRAKQVRRLHVVREDGNFAGKQGLCGAPGWGVTHSPPVIIEPLPAEPPAGLSWCNACLGHAVDKVGQTAAVARIVAALNDLGPLPQQTEDMPTRVLLVDELDKTSSGLPDETVEGACGRCRQTRRLFCFSWVPEGWAEFKEISLCARCHSLSAIEDEDGLLDSTPLLNQIGALR